MDFEPVWRELQERCGEMDPDEVLVTPSSERAFTVVATDEDRIVVEFEEGGHERYLWRDQFQVLVDRLATRKAGLSLDDPPAGVEPYVSVLSLSSRYAVDGGRIRRTTDADEEAESPFRRPEWTVRTRPERVHDDAVLLADLLERRDADDPESLPTDVLVDLYVLLSDVQRGSDRLRTDLRDLLLEYVGPDARLHGRFGTVRRTTRNRRRLRDEATVLNALDERGIPRDWVLGVDPDKLDVVLAVTELEEGDVYDVEEQVYVQKTAVEESAKQSRLQGLEDRLAELDSEDAADLRREIRDLERRLDAVLAAG